jgi:hypothetical protein
MSFVQRQAAHCDQCSHEWLVVGASTPTHCAKCKSRRWNDSDVLALAKSLLPPGALIPCDDPRSPKREDVLQEVVRRAPRVRPQHDPKTCRVYRCGLCAASKA